MVHVAVIGSGPSALGASLALLRRGAKVTVLDAGATLDEPRTELVARMRKSPPENWDPLLVKELINNPTISTRDIPQKLVFGSDYIYAKSDPDWPIERAGDVEAYSTFARGGYTTAWGATMLPMDDCDMADWPINRADLEPSYRRVLAEMPLSAVEDRLMGAFPLLKDRPDPLSLPPQCRALLDDLERACSAGDLGHFIFGRARLAVKGPATADGCRYCGLCLHSCPYGAIYSTIDKFDALIREGRIEYVGGAIVRRVAESSTGVRLDFVRSGECANRNFDYVFVGAGAISSTRLLLDSLELYNKPCTLKQSHKFVLPLLRLRRHQIDWPRINTLASLFIELKLSSASDHWSHVQVSPMNDLLLRRFGIDPILFSGRPPPWIAPFLERLMVAWCGIHSDHSSTIEVSLDAKAKGGGTVLRLSHRPNPDERRYSRKLAYALARRGWHFRTACLAPLRIDSKPGAGNHVGGSFPMTKNPRTTFQADLLGRLQGLRRVHVIDSAIFPSIPATTLMLPIMANADRIATQATLS